MDDFVTVNPAGVFFFLIHVCIYHLAFIKQIIISVSLLPQHSKDVSHCVKGGKGTNTKTGDPQQKDTLGTHRKAVTMDTNSQTRRLQPRMQTVGQEGWYHGCKIVTLGKAAGQTIMLLPWVQ